MEWPAWLTHILDQVWPSCVPMPLTMACGIHIIMGRLSRIRTHSNRISIRRTRHSNATRRTGHARPGAWAVAHHCVYRAHCVRDWLGHWARHLVVVVAQRPLCEGTVCCAMTSGACEEVRGHVLRYAGMQGTARACHAMRCHAWGHTRALAAA